MANGPDRELLAPRRARQCNEREGAENDRFHESLMQMGLCRTTLTERRSVCALFVSAVGDRSPFQCRQTLQELECERDILLRYSSLPGTDPTDTPGGTT